jgi:hypothetical protein
LDLQDAYSYFEQCKVGLGTEFMECVENALAKVSANYEHYPIVHQSIRRILVRRFPFAVFFKEVDNIILVFAFLHCARAPRAWRARL